MQSYARLFNYKSLRKAIYLNVLLIFSPILYCHVVLFYTGKFYIAAQLNILWLKLSNLSLGLPKLYSRLQHRNNLKEIRAISLTVRHSRFLQPHLADHLSSHLCLLHFHS